MLHTALQKELQRLDISEPAMIKTLLRLDDLEDAIRRVHETFADDLLDLKEEVYNGQPTCPPPVLSAVERAFHRTLHDLLLSRAEALEPGLWRFGARTKPRKPRS